MNIPSFFTGKTEFTATARTCEETSLYVLALPDEFSLSPHITLPYLNADAFRVCTEEAVVTDSAIDAFIDQYIDDFERRTSRVFPGASIKGLFDTEAFSSSLQWDKDISKMDATTPVMIVKQANTLYPIGIRISLWPFSIQIANQSFTVEGIDDHTVVYRFVFPKGIAVSAVDSAGASLSEGRTSGGREYVELSFDTDQDMETESVTVSLTASSLYMLVQFLPCIISLVLVIMLVVLVYLFKKKRRGKKSSIQEDTEATGYEGEDFYVPPPPSS